MQLNFKVRDLACKGGNDTYQGTGVYRMFEGNNVNTFLFGLGRTVIDDPKEALTEADLRLEQQYPYFKIGSAAVSIVRLCTAHEYPVVEIVQNVVAVSADTSGSHERLPGCMELPQDAPDIVTGYIRKPTGERYNPFEDVHPVYMPRQTYNAALEPHEAVWSGGGGQTGHILFGLLGGEKLIHIAPMPVVDYD